MFASDNFRFGLLGWTETNVSGMFIYGTDFHYTFMGFKLLLDLWLAQWRISEVLSITINITNVALTILLNTN